jgi:hypothetical protein
MLVPKELLFITKALIVGGYKEGEEIARQMEALVGNMSS